jgi:hypothetical protein
MLQAALSKSELHTLQICKMQRAEEPIACNFFAKASVNDMAASLSNRGQKLRNL